MKYYIRLDDACEKRDLNKWDAMEELLDKYGIKPLVGVIPCCQDPMTDKYDVDSEFWERVMSWQKKGWEIALHGCHHVFETEDGGLNPVNKRSEFSGVSLDRQREKIRKGMEVFRAHGIEPKVFFAPAHTFDHNTLKALKEESNIRIISDTVANQPYCDDGFTFVPQQSGKVRKLPFRVVTFCYHPNVMEQEDFDRLEAFVRKYHKRFHAFDETETTKKRTIFDDIMQWLYYTRRNRGIN